MNSCVFCIVRNTDWLTAPIDTRRYVLGVAPKTRHRCMHICMNRCEQRQEKLYFDSEGNIEGQVSIFTVMNILFIRIR